MNMITIPAFKKSSIEKRLDKLIKKAKKYGNEDITAHYSEPYIKEVVDYKTGEKVKISVITVSISGDAPKIDGHKFLGRVEILDGKNAVHSVTSTPINIEFRVHDGECDHCNTKRRRKDVYVFENSNGGQMAIGRSCMRDYLGIDDPKEIVHRASFYESLSEFDEDEKFTMPSGMHKTSSIIETTIAIINKYGWVSKAKAQMTGNLSTADSVKAYFTGVCEYDLTFDDALREKAKNIIEYFRNMDDPDSEYLGNLNAILSQDVISNRQLGFACSAVVAYEKAIAPKVEKKVKSVFMGAIKERLRNLVLTVEKEVYLGSGPYGDKYLYTFITEEGFQAVWFTGKQNITGTLKADGTVKDHREYNGVKQTVLTRIKFKEGA